MDDNTSQQVNFSETTDYEDDDRPGGFNPVIYCSIMAVMTALGIVGNSLIIVIFSVEPNRKRSFSVYLRALAISDSVVLLTILVDDVITRLIDKSILYGNKDICSAYYLWFVFWVHFSAGLLVLVALDRYIAIAYPLKRALLCSCKRAIYLTIGTALFCICLNLYQVIWNEVEAKSRDVHRVYSCPVMRSLVYEIIFSVHKFAFIFLLPFCVVLVLNLRVIYFIKTSLQVKQNPNSVSVVRATLPVITITLSSVCFIFPVLVVEVAEFVLRWIDIPSFNRKVIDKTWEVTNLLRMFNYVANFYVLILFTKTYRTTLTKACCCTKISGPDDNIINMANKSSTMATDCRY